MGGSRSGRLGSSKPFAETLRRLDVADYTTEMNVEAARHVERPQPMSDRAICQMISRIPE